MGRGRSGRMVVELEPELKDDLYIALSIDRLTFKDWLTAQAHRYVSERRQPSLLTMAEPSPPTYAPEKPRGRSTKRKEQGNGRRRDR